MTETCVCSHALELHVERYGPCSSFKCTCLRYRSTLTGAEAAVERIEELLAWAKENYLREVDVNDVRRALDGEERPHHVHRWMDVSRMGDSGPRREVCTVEGCGAERQAPR